MDQSGHERCVCESAMGAAGAEAAVAAMRGSRRMGGGGGTGARGGARVAGRICGIGRTSGWSKRNGEDEGGSAELRGDGDDGGPAVVRAKKGGGFDE